MKIILRTLGIISALIVLGLVAAFFIGSHYEAGPPPISSSRALVLINNCYQFTHTEQGDRRAIAITHTAKGQGGTDAGSDLSFVDFNWQANATLALTGPLSGTGKASFRWIPIPGLSDFNFPESQWRLVSLEVSPGHLGLSAFIVKSDSGCPPSPASLHQP